MMKTAWSAIVLIMLAAPLASAQQVDIRSRVIPVSKHPAQLTGLSRWLQNEIQELPADHSALFAASREVSIELEIPSTGDLAALEDALVTIIRPDGRVAEVRPDQNGLVTIDQVQEGPHAFVVLSQQVHGAKLMYLKQASDQEVDAAAVPPMPLAEVPREPLLRLMEDLSDVDGPLSDLKSSLPVGSEFGYRVGLEPDGMMRGKIMPIADSSEDLDLEGMSIAIYFRGIRIAETKSDGSGEFEIPDLQPGIYGMVVAGAEGYAAFAFEAVAADKGLSRRDDRQRLVTQAIRPAAKVPVVLIPPPMIPALLRAIQRYYATPQQMTYAADSVGVPVGGFMATGFSGGGFDGMAALLGLGAAILLDDDNDGRLRLPTAASPSTPNRL